MREIVQNKKPIDIEELRKLRQAKKEAKQKLSESSSQELSLVVLERPFAEMPEQNKLEEKLGEIRVMTFNVLAQGLIKRALFPHSGDILKWKNRREMLIDEIKLYNPDILALQELDNFEQYYKDVFTSLGYKTKYTKFGTKAHGCAIAYKQDKFDFIDYKAIDYDTDTTYPPPNLTGNIAQLLALQLISNPKACFIVGNTHLYWKPLASYERLRQSIIFSNRLLEFKSELSENRKSNKWMSILSGDFNTSASEPAYSMLTNNGLAQPTIRSVNTQSPDIDTFDVSDLLLKYTPCQWHSIYSDYYKINPNKEEQGTCGEPKYTNYTVVHKGLLDYIFIEKNASIIVKRMLTLPKEELLLPSLPNKNFGSDHLCLAVDIEF